MITLHDYLMWIAGRESNITPELIANQLMLEDMSAEQIQAFYDKHKNSELKEFKEEYKTGKYRGSNVYETTFSFYIDDMHFVIPGCCCSFLLDSNPTAQNYVNKISKLANDLSDELFALRSYILEEEKNGRVIGIDGRPLLVDNIRWYLDKLDYLDLYNDWN